MTGGAVPRAARGAAAALAALALAGCAATPRLPRQATGPLRVDQAQASGWVSDYRKAHGLSAVTQDPALQAVAQAQASAMAEADALSHTIAGPLPHRLAGIGRQSQAAAENVSAGYADLEAALGGWRRSPEHDKNLLFPPMRRIGVAAATAPSTRYKTFWALVMTD